MTATLTREAIYDGGWPKGYRGHSNFVLGAQFGPMLLAVNCCGLQQASDEWDERHGERVEPDDAALADYEGETVADRIESAMNDGDIRINDGGTTVWVDHYEWVREFATPAEAGRFFRKGDA